MKITCCDQEMRAMGMWPIQRNIGVVKKEEVGGGWKSDGSTYPVDIFIDRYHCLKCNAYVSVLEDPIRDRS
jgi:hypothetical protein